jgi:hypothetical protein
MIGLETKERLVLRKDWRRILHWGSYILEVCVCPAHYYSFVVPYYSLLSSSIGLLFDVKDELCHSHFCD